MKSNLSKKFKKNEGITLVALVVTIIVLLILAGVSISLVFNSDGLFSKANEAASRYNQAKENELAFLQGVDEYFDRYNGVNGGGSGTVTPTPNPTPVLPAKGEEPPEEGWTVEQAKGLVERDGLKDHLGEKVQYSPAGDPTGVYRIFYYDNEVNSEDPTKGYFGDKLNTLYLKRDYVSNDTTLSDYTSYNPTDNGAVMKQMNPKWAVASNGSSIDLENEHCVSWLCDPSQWTKYKVDGVAKYVIGSPSVEMYMKAYGVYKEADGDPDRNSTALVCKIGSANGYSVGANNIYANSGIYTVDNSIEAGPNNIFMTAESLYWLTSPSSSKEDSIFVVLGSRTHVGSSVAEFDHAYGVCPIVSII